MTSTCCPPQWFFNNADRYDDYARGDMKIFVGEYAAHGPGRRNNLEAALAEAAFMTGLERNSDIVHMAAHTAVQQGRLQSVVPDLIWFDNTRVYGTPSYYVQKMFSTNLGDRILPHEYETDEAVPEQEPISGRVGLGAWRTRVEYDFIRVTAGDSVLLYDDFDDELVGWESKRAVGAFERDAQADGHRRRLHYFGRQPHWSNYTIEVRARKISGAEGMLIPLKSRTATTTTGGTSAAGVIRRQPLKRQLQARRRSLAAEQPCALRPVSGMT